MRRTMWSFPGSPLPISLLLYLYSLHYYAVNFLRVMSLDFKKQCIGLCFIIKRYQIHSECNGVQKTRYRDQKPGRTRRSNV